jgi:hypothetical protein
MTERFTAMFTEQMQAQVAHAQRQAEAAAQRTISEFQAQQAIQAFAQDATTATINRRHALPFTATELVALLTETPAAVRPKWQAALSKINESGLVPFDEIGSVGEGPAEQSAKEQFDAAVLAEVTTGMSRLNAMQAVAKEQPALYQSYQAESRPARTTVAPRKGGT